MLNEKQKELLISYRDKSLINADLFQAHSNHYSFINSLFSLPIIITSSAMTVINSSFPPDDVKIINIILNASTSLILSLMGNFKFNERATNFLTTSRKMTLLSHSIEDYILNLDVNGNGDIEFLRNFIKQYDDIEQSLNYPLVESINKKIIDKYKNDNRALPNALNMSNFTLSSICFKNDNRQQPQTP